MSTNNETETRAQRRTAALQRVAQTGGAEAREAQRVLDQETAGAVAKAKADRVAALPKSIADAKGDVRAFAKASMVDEMAKQGLTPVRL